MFQLSVENDLQRNMSQIQSWKTVWNKQQIWDRAKEMFVMRGFHNVEWPALSLLWLRAKNKAKRQANKTEYNDPAKCKKNLKPFAAVNCHSNIKK